MSVPKTSHSVAEQLRLALWLQVSARVYAVMDGLAVPGLADRLSKAKAQGELDAWDSLPRGALSLEQTQAAAAIVQLQKTSVFTDWLLGEACTAHADWGVLLVSECPFLTLREHARALMQVSLPGGERRLWRWYAPDLLRLMMPLLSAQQACTLLRMDQGALRLMVPGIPPSQQWSTYRCVQGVVVCDVLAAQAEVD
jgi:hypothetical protein